MPRKEPSRWRPTTVSPRQQVEAELEEGEALEVVIPRCERGGSPESSSTTILMSAGALFGGPAYGAMSGTHALALTSRRVFFLGGVDRIFSLPRTSVRVVEYVPGDRWIGLWLSIEGSHTQYHVWRGYRGEVDTFVRALGGVPPSPDHRADR